MSDSTIFNPSPKNFSLKTWTKENIVLLLILATSVLVVYTNSLSNDFVADDIFGIVNNPLMGKLEYFKTNFFAYPLRKVLHSISFTLGGQNPLYFRAPIIFTHLLNSIIIFLLVSLLKNKRVGFTSAIIFAVHPILSEAVIWISAGSYVYSTFFVLISFLSYYLSDNNRRLIYLSAISFLIALNFSAFAISLPFILLFFEWSRGNIKTKWKNTLPFFLILLLGAIMYAFILSLRISTLSISNGLGLGDRNPLVQVPVIVSTYLELLFWPQNLTLYHSDLGFSLIGFSTILFTKTAFALKLASFFIFTGLMIIAYIKSKFIFFWLTFFILTITITFMPFSISWTVAERYVYLGSVGIIVVFATILDTLVKKQEHLTFTLLVLVTLLGIRTVVRNTNWKTADSLWVSAAKYSPSSHQNRNNLGDLFSRRGNFDKAIEEFEIAIKLKPDYADAYHNLGHTYSLVNDFENAESNFLKAVEIRPTLWQSHRGLAKIHLNTFKLEEATVNIDKALEIYPNDPISYTLYALIELEKGDKEKAIELLNVSLGLSPQNPQALAVLEDINSNQ